MIPIRLSEIAGDIPNFERTVDVTIEEGAVVEADVGGAEAEGEVEEVELEVVEAADVKVSK